MRSYFILLILSFFSSSIFAQIAQQTTEWEERSNSHCLDYIEWRISICADSLNFWKEGNNLPAFVFDEKFDLKHTFTNTCFKEANPFSFRRFIINRVYNIKALQYLVESKDTRLDSLFVPTDAQLKGEGLALKDFYKKFPYRTHSTRNLAEKRLKELTEYKKNFK